MVDYSLTMAPVLMIHGLLLPLRVPTPYTLPPGHPLAVAKAVKATGSTVPTSSGTAASSIGADAAGGSPGISRSAFERNLNELERTSTDPNAAATCTLLRNLLLKR